MSEYFLYDFWSDFIKNADPFLLKFKIGASNFILLILVCLGLFFFGGLFPDPKMLPLFSINPDNSFFGLFFLYGRLFCCISEFKENFRNAWLLFRNSFFGYLSFLLFDFSKYLIQAGAFKLQRMTLASLGMLDKDSAGVILDLKSWKIFGILVLFLRNTIFIELNLSRGLISGSLKINEGLRSLNISLMLLISEMICFSIDFEIWIIFLEEIHFRFFKIFSTFEWNLRKLIN